MASQVLFSQAIAAALPCLLLCHLLSLRQLKWSPTGKGIIAFVEFEDVTSAAYVHGALQVSGLGILILFLGLSIQVSLWSPAAVVRSAAEMSVFLSLLGAEVEICMGADV